MNERPLNILLLSDASSVHTIRLNAELAKQNCLPTLASLEDGEVVDIVLKKRTPFKQLHYFLSVFQVASICNSIKPDLIYANYAAGYGFVAAAASIFFKVPIVLNIWGSDILVVPQKSFLHKQKVKFALRKSDLIFSDSKYLAEEAEKIHKKINYMVIPWGIEKEFLNLFQADKTFSTPFKIIVPRTHEKVYENFFIVKALHELIRNNKVVLTFPDFGSLAKSFKEKSRELVGDKIEFYKKMEREQFLEFFSNHDIYLSNASSDSSPVSLIESMALGLVPVCADIKGVREWMADGAGLKYEQNNKDALKNCIETIIAGGVSFEKMKKKNFDKVKELAVFENNIARQIKKMKILVGLKK